MRRLSQRQWNRANRASNGLGAVRGLIASVLCCLLCVLAACAPVPQPTVSLTPAATRAAASPTVALLPGLQRLAFVGEGVVRPSPDGTLIAVVTDGGTALTLYSIAGQARGHFSASSGHQVYTPGWLPDSSGLFVADIDPNAQTATPPLLIMAPDGSTHPTGLDAGANTGDAPVVSPDNQWVADAASTAVCCSTQVEVAPRAGGTKHIVPRANSTDSDWLLGWQNGQIIYFDSNQAAIYAIPPTGGSAKLLMQTPNKVLLVPDAIGLSPDGQALSLTTSRGEHWVLAGTHLQQAPPAIAAFTYFWAGQGHTVIASLGGHASLIDVVTGAVVHDTRIAASDVYAVAGGWAITATGGGLHAINYATNVDRALGFASGGFEAYALGPGRFLLHHQQTPGDTYIVDAALLGS